MEDPPKALKGQLIRQFVLDNVHSHPKDIAKLASAEFGVSRQAVNRHIHSLVDDGLLVIEGRTAAATYRLSTTKRQWILPVRGLAEHAVWDAELAPLLKKVPDNVVAICEYGFTEMLNNVVDHSESVLVIIEFEHSPELINIEIHDTGVGIFNKIQRACGLDDARHAVFELTKGKLTTDPTRHTGEGVFFTSRMFDRFSILAGGLFLAHRRDKVDWLIGDKVDAETGTLVTLEISPTSVHTAAEIFDRYATDQDDFAFSKTHVLVKLSDVSDRFVSRSQAKRIVARLERFKEVVLDFDRVTELGPAFADDVFRVFAERHPSVHLVPINANEQVTKMIRRALISRGPISEAGS